MNIYFSYPYPSNCIHRVVTSLATYFPSGMQRVEKKEEADLVVLHVIGRHDHSLLEAQDILRRGQKYAVIQYALASTRNPRPEEWQELWKDAQVVWSYYDLEKYMSNYYCAPLGASAEKFHPLQEQKQYLIGTLGHPDSYQIECFGEVHLAAFQNRAKVIHVGKMFGANPMVEYASEITDEELCKVYNRCTYFSCLRRKEGFEMPAVEALLCGTRPILFDTPDYRKWFDPMAIFLPEASPAKVIRNLREVFRHAPQPVSDLEIQKVREKFDWKIIVEGFWQRCMT
jgi:hypothetical protein